MFRTQPMRRRRDDLHARHRRAAAGRREMSIASELYEGEW